MLGVIFTNLIEMMEQEVGLELTETVLEEANLESKAVYTSVGFYSPAEVVAIVTTLSAHTGIPVVELVESFGVYLFPKLAEYHPQAVRGKKSVIEVLSILDSNIHVEVQKLYPDAQLPDFKTIEESPTHIKMRYTSENSLESLAKGLIIGGASYFNEEVEVDISVESADYSFITVRKINPD